MKLYIIFKCEKLLENMDFRVDLMRISISLGESKIPD